MPQWRQAPVSPGSVSLRFSAFLSFDPFSSAYFHLLFFIFIFFLFIYSISSRVTRSFPFSLSAEVSYALFFSPADRLSVIRTRDCPHYYSKRQKRSDLKTATGHFFKKLFTAVHSGCSSRIRSNFIEKKKNVIFFSSTRRTTEDATGVLVERRWKSIVSTKGLVTR